MKKLLYLFVFISSLSFAQDGGLKTLIATGPANAYVISEALPATYNQKERFQIIFPVSNTGASTINRAGLGLKDIRKNDGSALSSGDITAGNPYFFSYSSANGYYVCETCGGGGGVSGSGTPNELAYWTGATSLGTLAVATYPSLTELIHVKGLTGPVMDTFWRTSGTSTLTGGVTIAQGGFNTTFSGTGKVTFSPSATLSGFNFGSFAGAPSGLSNGDAWYNSTNTDIGVYVNSTSNLISTILFSSLVSNANRIPYLSSNGRAQLTHSANLFFDGTGLLVGGGTITASTRLDVRGIGTTTNKTFRTASSTNTQTFEILDNANINALPISGSIMTLGGGATASELRFLEPGGGSYVGLKAPSLAGNITFTLPPAFVVGGVPTDVAGDGVLTMVVPSGSGSTYYAPTTIDTPATDADFTAVVKSIKHLPAATLTANRTITIPTGADGDVIELHNNEAAYSWLLAGATVYLSDRTTTVTALLYNVPTLMQKINGLWIIKN